MQDKSSLQKKYPLIKKDWKFYLGIGFLLCAILSDLAFLIVPFMRFSAAKIISLLAILVISAEIFFLFSILLIGKILIEKIKEKFRILFKKKEFAGPVYISKHRHYIGVFLFFLSFIPYPIVEVSLLFKWSSNTQHINFFILFLAGDILFLVSLFILGYPFWEKLKSLFNWNYCNINNTIREKNQNQDLN